MEPNELAVRHRARLAYELGRARRAAQLALLSLPMLALAMLGPRAAHASFNLWLAAAALSIAVFALSLRGLSAGRAIRFALCAGLVPLVLPIAVRTLGQACDSMACMSFCLPACIASGAIAGAALSMRARREESTAARREFLASAVLVSALAGALGCSTAGAAGVLGMLAAELLASLPAWRAAT